ncbi:unnamed protein product [Polarella glacialis]|uniref:Endonuclease/exonuclease/phosphatase domain-containing protein n=1 Tax=Polarella glacialis TaxID=89957 RepID=A0A813H5Y5_POLGL|nr:unnamed protein product [Polarella glacialis]
MCGKCPRDEQETSAGASAVPLLRVWWDTGDALERLCDIIRHTQPDLAGLQERSLGAAEYIAKACGMYCAGGSDGQQPVLSRWPIEPLSPQCPVGRGFRVKLPDGRELLWYNMHLRSYPYAPYVLHGFSASWDAKPFDDPFEALIETPKIDPRNQHEAALGVERQTQLPELLEVLEDMQARSGTHAAVFITGDFNAASHHDYPKGPQWLCSSECEARGLTDSFAESRRQGTATLHPANTWAAKEEQEPHGVFDRIDFVYCSTQVEVQWSMHLDGSNSGVPQWPSDHRAVLSAFSYPAAGKQL